MLKTKQKELIYSHFILSKCPIVIVVFFTWLREPWNDRSAICYLNFIIVRTSIIAYLFIYFVNHCLTLSSYFGNENGFVIIRFSVINLSRKQSSWNQAQQPLHDRIILDLLSLLKTQIFWNPILVSSANNEAAIQQIAETSNIKTFLLPKAVRGGNSCFDMFRSCLCHLNVLKSCQQTNRQLERGFAWLCISSISFKLHQLNN